MFITHNISTKVLDRYIRKLKTLKRVYTYKALKIPEQYKESVKLALLRRMAELTIERIKIGMEEQKNVRYDEEITLKSKEPTKEPLEFQDILSDRYLRGMSSLEHEIKVRIVYCKVNHMDRRIGCECNRLVREEIIAKHWKGKRTIPDWEDSLIERCDRSIDMEIKAVIEERGEERMKRYYGKINPYMWSGNRWF